jgi:hypothetical protein
MYVHKYKVPSIYNSKFVSVQEYMEWLGLIIDANFKKGQYILATYYLGTSFFIRWESLVCSTTGIVFQHYFDNWMYANKVGAYCSMKLSNLPELWHAFF